MKTIIFLVVLLSSSLLAENLPKPFGIQLGEVISEDILCYGSGVNSQNFINAKKTIKKYKDDIWMHMHYCDKIIPLKKNKHYSEYSLSTDDDLIVYAIYAENSFPKSKNNFEIVLEYQKNLISFLEKKYKLNIIFSAPSCEMFKFQEANISQLQKNNLIKNCKIENEIVQLYVWDNQGMNRYEVDKKRWTLKYNYELNYKERSVSIDECLSVYKTHKDYKPASWDMDSRRYSLDSCYLDITLENDQISIEIMTTFFHDDEYKIYLSYRLKDSLSKSRIKHEKLIKKLDEQSLKYEENKKNQTTPEADTL